MRAKLISGDVRLNEDDRWILLNKYQYGEDYYVHPDADVYSDVWRAQWVRTSGLIATLDYYVRKNDDDGAEMQWKVTERVHFYDPDEGDFQIRPRTFQHDFCTATDENFEKAVTRARQLLDSRDNSHLTNWWEEWKDER